MIWISETFVWLSSLLCLSLLHFLWQAVTVALVASVAGLALRQRSAQAEYIALVIGLALLPAAFAATLVWQSTRLPPAADPVTMPLPATVAAPTSTPTELQSRLNEPITAAESELSTQVGSTTNAASAAPAAWDWHSIAPWLGAVYLFGVLAMCVRLLIGLGGARQLCCAAARVRDRGVLESLAQQCRRVGLRLAPPIAYCRDVSVPTLVGILRPTILLPLSAVSGLLPAELESILLHELVHIRRYDHLLNLGQRLVEAAFFFHPAVWFLSRRITVVREHCCDDAVLALGAQRAVYIESLMRVAELSITASRLVRQGAVVGLHATDMPSRLRQRIARLLDPPGRTTLRLKPAALLFIGALLVGSLTTPLLLTALACPRQHRDQCVAAISDSPPTDNKNATPKTQPAQPLHFSGIVVDKFTQKPIDCASVTVHRLEEGKHVEIEYGHSQWKNEELGKPEDIVTDANGRYEFTITAEQVADPRFQLATEVRHPHYLHPLPNWEHASISSILADIKEGKHPWLEKIELLPTRTVSGVIVDPTGHPLPSCEVMLISKKRRKPVLSDGSKALTWSETNKKLVDNAWDTANTDVQGRFNLQAVQGAELAKIWAEPKDFAVLEREIDPVVAQLGTLKLDTGARVAGTVVDEHEKPLVGVSVGCFPLEERNWHAIRTPRGAVTTDERGQFSLAPVAFGKYQVGVGDRRFVPIQVELSPDNPLAPITFRPHPLATVRVSFVDRAGKPSALLHPEIAISGSMAKVPYVGRLRRSLGHADGEVPIGLEDSVLEGIGISDYLVSWRLGDREKLQPAGYSPEGFKLGAINGPTEITVVETKLPRLIVRAVGTDGKPIMKFLPRIDYKDPALTRHAAPFKNGGKGDVLMIESTTLADSQPKPGQWFSFRLLSDQEFTVTAEAAGYQPASQSLKMAEGETREITLTLAAETKKSSIIAPIKADTAVGDKAPSPAGKVGGAAVVKHIYFQPPANETATKGAMRIHVVGTDGRRIAAVKIRAYVSTKEKDFNGSREYVCDDNGSVDVKLPGKLYTLRLFAIAAGYAPLSAHWESERPAAPTILPDEFTFSLKMGTVIGGFVKNDDDQPISGAKVWVRAIDFSDPDEVGRYDVALSEGSDAVTTDAQGHWSLNNVPPRGRGVLIGLTHPDYISDCAWGESQEKQHVATEAFLDQTAIIKMHRGTSVTGMITNSEGKPISGALVIRNDDPYISLFSQGDMETDKNGVYRVPPLPTGAIKLTVVAPGCTPQLRDLEIKPGLGPVDFQLKPGRTLRMKFVDKSGKPVPHVGVTVDKWRGGTSLCNIFHPDAHIPTHADASGIYEWSGAPDDPMSCMLFQKDLWTVGGVAVTADDREHTWVVPSSSDGYETLAAEADASDDVTAGDKIEKAMAPRKTSTHQ